jgi:hypothetical protein
MREFLSRCGRSVKAGRTIGAMVGALRDLARNGWVLGIAAAIAIGYGVVAFLLAVADLVLEAFKGGDASGPFAFEVRGVPIAYERVAQTAVTLAVVVGAAALALQWAARTNTADNG